MTSLKIKEFSEISVGELTIFMEKSSGDNAVAHIFSDRELIGEITVLSINQNDTGLYNELFRTMKKTEPPSDANKLYMDGVTHMTSQRLETAKRNFASAVAVNPKDAEFRYMLAETLALTGYVSSAKRQLEKCLEINPNHNRAEKLSEALSKLK
jgi:tetratricopeptide (TPR) repeat protein